MRFLCLPGKSVTNVDAATVTIAITHPAAHDLIVIAAAATTSNTASSHISTFQLPCAQQSTHLTFGRCSTSEKYPKYLNKHLS